MKIIRISSLFCTSCIITNADFEALKKEHPTWEFIEKDYDMEDVSEYHVGKVLPVMIVYQGEEEMVRIVGEKKKKEIDQILKDFV